MLGSLCIECGTFVSISKSKLKQRCDHCSKIYNYAYDNLARYWHNVNKELGTGRIDMHKNKDNIREARIVRKEFYRLGILQRHRQFTGSAATI